MKKITLMILVALLFFARAGGVVASEPQAGASASLAQNSAKAKTYDHRFYLLRSYLESRNSPLVDEVDTLLESADRHGLDWRLIPAITGVESSFAIRMPQNSYNAYGWANGTTKFSSWDQSIEVVAKTLREKYIDKGAKTIPQIARRYAPPSTTWASKVTFFMNKIDPVPVTFDL